MKILLIDNGTSFIEELKKWLGDNDISVKPFSSVSSEETKNYDVVILSGGHVTPVIGHDSDYKDELNIIKNSSMPIIGICLGFELIAHAFGAKLERMDKKEEGMLEIKLKDGQSVLVYESHRWVIKDPGPELMPLGESKDGIEIVKHTSKPVYGFQFHPEMTPDKRFLELLIKELENEASYSG